MLAEAKAFPTCSWPRPPVRISPSSCDPDMMNVGPAGRVPLFVRVTRRQGFSGRCRSAVEGLPAGVRASPLTIPPSMNEGVIVIEAATDAKRDSALVSLKATGQGP